MTQPPDKPALAPDPATGLVSAIECARAALRRRRIRARYPSRCGTCRQRIRVGDEIAHRYGSGALHAGCFGGEWADEAPAA